MLNFVRPGDSFEITAEWYNSLVEAARRASAPEPITIHAATPVVLVSASGAVVPGSVRLEDLTSWGTGAAVGRVRHTLVSGPGRLETPGQPDGASVVTAAGVAASWTWDATDDPAPTWRTATPRTVVIRSEQEVFTDATNAPAVQTTTDLPNDDDTGTRRFVAAEGRAYRYDADVTAGADDVAATDGAWIASPDASWVVLSEAETVLVISQALDPDYVALTRPDVRVRSAATLMTPDGTATETFDDATAFAGDVSAVKRTAVVHVVDNAGVAVPGVPSIPVSQNAGATQNLLGVANRAMTAQLTRTQGHKITVTYTTAMTDEVYATVAERDAASPSEDDTCVVTSNFATYRYTSGAWVADASLTETLSTTRLFRVVPPLAAPVRLGNRVAKPHVSVRPTPEGFDVYLGAPITFQTGLRAVDVELSPDGPALPLPDERGRVEYAVPGEIRTKTDTTIAPVTSVFRTAATAKSLYVGDVVKPGGGIDVGAALAIARASDDLSRALRAVEKIVVHQYEARVSWFGEWETLSPFLKEGAVIHSGTAAHSLRVVSIGTISYVESLDGLSYIDVEITVEGVVGSRASVGDVAYVTGAADAFVLTAALRYGRTQPKTARPEIEIENYGGAGSIGSRHVETQVLLPESGVPVASFVVPRVSNVPSTTAAWDGKLYVYAYRLGQAPVLETIDLGTEEVAVVTAEIDSLATNHDVDYGTVRVTIATTEALKGAERDDSDLFLAWEWVEKTATPAVTPSRVLAITEPSSREFRIPEPKSEAKLHVFGQMRSPGGQCGPVFSLLSPIIAIA